MPVSTRKKEENEIRLYGLEKGRRANWSASLRRSSRPSGLPSRGSRIHRRLGSHSVQVGDVAGFDWIQFYAAIWPSWIVSSLSRPHRRLRPNSVQVGHREHCGLRGIPSIETTTIRTQLVDRDGFWSSTFIS